MWIALAQRYIQGIHLDWNKTCQLAFNPDACPEDEQLEAQIMKVNDAHERRNDRTRRAYLGSASDRFPLVVE